MKRLLIALFVVGLTASPALGAAGVLDTTYSGDGITVSTFGSAEHVVVDSQNRVMVGGQVLPSKIDAGRPSLQRYRANGSLDPTLDGDGRMSLPVAGTVRGLALQGGNILVATESALWRLLPNGAPDTSFGTNGKIQFPDSRTVVGRHPLWATGSRAYIILSDPQSGSAVFYFTADGGHSSASFWTDIKMVSIALHQGYVYAVGATYDRFNSGRVIIVRFGTSPSMFLDESFNQGRGHAYGPALIYDQYGGVTAYTPMDIAVSATSGKITVVGDKYDCNGGSCSTYTHGFAMRFLSGGALDATFGGAGEVWAGCTNGGEGMTSVVLQGGKTIAAGESWSEDDPVRRFGVTRLTPNGSTDTTFSRAACFGGPQIAGSIVEDATLAGGKIVVVGGVYTARYLAA